VDRKDWFEWHRPYDDPTSDLAQRLGAVQRRIAEVLRQAPPGPIRVVSMCAGQGRDLLGVLVDHPRRGDVAARLVELELRNARAAEEVARAAGLDRVEVVVGDASTTTAYDGAVPADLVLACGVFGHATDDDIRTTIGHLPMLCAPRATVVWTRGGFGSDLRPTIRRWFADEGFAEIGFDSGGESGWGVGANRLAVAPPPHRPGVRLFTFVDEHPSRGL